MKEQKTRKPGEGLSGQNHCKLQQDKRKALKPLGFQDFMVAGTGLEPATSGL